MHASHVEVSSVAQDINPQLVARLSQRLFFVVNKVDLMHTSEGLEPEEIKEYVADLVTKQLASEGFRLSSDQVTSHPSLPLLLYTEVVRNVLERTFRR